MPRIKYYSIRMQSVRTGEHVSGAEGIYEKDDVKKIVQQYTTRALTHEKGRADEIRLTVEELKEKVHRISTLPLSTINTRDPESAKRAATRILSSVGITERAIEEAFKALTVGITMRGAILMDIEGVRLEPDLLRGVRVTRMGISKKASADLSRKLTRHRINNDTVKEALILASKVHKYRMVLGELCISDDPNYTTGYIATRAHGYIRLPRIKKRGISYGGRAFFITGGEVKQLIKYLQKEPVLINEIKPCSGTLKLKDILNTRKPRMS
ncbi:MAG TPA: 6-carboxyhexanoate--CoA ligase [Nitrospirae bacterium]|nr:6-carboxyhexanoate--CoA ligase [Nitrospirota bacterium]HDZ83679.1 6-carboxyhexanoate--CoA ligase [Nitrospirota bacterium]